MKISLLFSTTSTFSVFIVALRSVLIVSSVECFISSPRLCNRHLSISVDRKSPSSASRILPPLYTSSVGGASSDNTSFLIEQRLLTLYEILQVPQNATRQELRKQYLTQAKSLHPDSSSSIAKRIIDVAGQEIEIEFTQVVSAWKILSDPIERKRYDRKLQADAITGGVGRAAEQFGKRTAPYMKQVFENVAIPLIRRTSATTQAIINAASEDIAQQQKQKQNNTKDVDLRKIALSAFEASQKANLEIDRYELELKLKELDKKYQDDTAHLAKLESQIEETTQKRLRVALRVPKENMSAQDALSVWESLNLTDRRSLFQPTPVQFKIEQLEVAESDYNIKKEERDRFEAEYERCKRAVDEANRKAKKAVEKVERLKKDLLESKEEVMQSRKQLSDYTKNMTTLETTLRRTSADVEKLSSALEKRREVVKATLLEKEESVLKDLDKVARNNVLNLGGFSSNSGGEAQQQQGDSLNNENEVKEAMKELNALKNEESFLREESFRLKNKTARIKSRSEKLKRRCEALKRQDDGGGAGGP